MKQSEGIDMDIISPKKAKSLKNAEKRRERSKVAARCRRGKESEIFSDLSDCLPIPEATKSNLDKASIMRLTLCHLKLKQMMDSGFIHDDFKKMCLNKESDSLINSALGGFILAFSLDGDVIYASEGITTQLGLCQYEIMGQSIFDFTHQYDHNDIRLLLTVKKGDAEHCNPRSALFRMKCTVSSRGRNAHLRTSNHKVVNCVGRIMVADSGSSSDKWFVSICEPLLHPSDVDIPLNKQSFLTKHTSDMKFEYIDESVSELMGYCPKEMLGKSLFEFCHAADGEGVAKSFKSLYEKDQNQTERYRFLTKGGGWIWIVTQATIIHSSNGKTTDSIVCINFITSGREEHGAILSEVQMSDIPETIIIPTPRNVLSENRINLPQSSMHHEDGDDEMINGIPCVKLQPMNIEEENDFLTEFLGSRSEIENNPKCTTETLFTRRTDEMNIKDSLVPIVETPVLKFEPKDLTCLAPVAGDSVISLRIPIHDNLIEALNCDGIDYSILDPDSDDIPMVDLSSFLQYPSKSFTQMDDFDTTSLIMESDPHMINSPDSASSLYSPYRSSSPSSSNQVQGDEDFSMTMRKSQEPQLQFLDDDYLLLSPKLCSMPPVSFDVDFEEFQQHQPTIFENPSILYSTQENLQQNINYGSIDPTQSSKMTISSSNDQDIPQDCKLDLLKFNTCLLSEIDGPTPNKITKIMKSTGSTMNFNSAAGYSHSRVYILVPVSRRRTPSIGSNTGLISDSESDSNDSGAFNVVDAGQAVDNRMVKELLTRIGMELSVPSTANIQGEHQGRPRKRDSTGNLLSKPTSFLELTHQDCEVNAPLKGISQLLEGPELLKALDVEGM